METRLLGRPPLRALGFRGLALLANATAYIVCVRLMLWLVPARRLLRYVDGKVENVGERGSGTSAGAPSVDIVAWSIRAVGRRIPSATCLVQALAAQLLLARHGHASNLRIGVAKDGLEFVAHAWVQVDQRIVVGHQRGMRYTELPNVLKALG